MSDVDPFDRWLADAGWADDVDGDGAAPEEGVPDPWRSADVVVDGLSEEQLAFLGGDQPPTEPLRPDHPGVDGFEEG